MFNTYLKKLQCKLNNATLFPNLNLYPLLIFCEIHLNNGGITLSGAGLNAAGITLNSGGGGSNNGGITLCAASGGAAAASTAVVNGGLSLGGISLTTASPLPTATTTAILTPPTIPTAGVRPSIIVQRSGGLAGTAAGKLEGGGARFVLTTTPKAGTVPPATAPGRLVSKRLIEKRKDTINLILLNL